MARSTLNAVRTSRCRISSRLRKSCRDHHDRDRYHTSSLGLLQISWQTAFPHPWQAPDTTCLERCCEAENIRQVIVATDDMRIAEAAFGFGAEVALTRADHPSGTDRIAEVARKLKSEVILNVQGDEPAMEPQLISRLATALIKDPSLDMATAACPFPAGVPASHPNNVKVVTDLNSNALYFSRSLIPFDRDGAAKAVPLWHMGLYAYRRTFLLRYVRWPQSLLEQSEKLEQLRAMEHGAKIKVLVAKTPGVGVDTPGDVRRAEKLLRSRQKK